MHFTIAAAGRLFSARYHHSTRQIEFSDGRAPLKVGRAESALDVLRRAFRDCLIVDDRGQSYAPSGSFARPPTAAVS